VKVPRENPARTSGYGRAVPDFVRPCLPPEVLDLLSLGGRVRLSHGGGGETRVTDVAVAPLEEGLFCFLPAGSDILSALERDPACVLMAEQDSPAWRVVSRGRGVPGRLVVLEPLRAQLAYWLPERSHPESLVAVRFLPEHLDYTRAGEKIQGAVPNGARPEPLAAWWALAIERQWFWIGCLLVSNFFAGIFIEEDTTARLVIVAAVLVPGFLLLAGRTLWNHGAVAQRWREGAESEALAWAVQRGWLGATQLRARGVQLMLVGVALLPLLAFAQARLIPLAVFSSGFGFAGPFQAVRHFFRASDVEPSARLPAAPAGRSSGAGPSSGGRSS